MAKELTALSVRGNLGEILEQVYYRGEEFIIKRGKKPMAVLISPEEFESYKKQRKSDMEVFDRIRARAKGIPADEVQSDVAAAIKAVRKRA